MTVEPEINPQRKRRTRSRREESGSAELRQLVEEMRRQNLLLKRYLFLFGAGLAVLLVLQLDIAKLIFNYALVAAVVIAVLLTSPWWSRLIVYLTDRIPWYPRNDSSSRK